MEFCGVSPSVFCVAPWTRRVPVVQEECVVVPLFTVFIAEITMNLLDLTVRDIWGHCSLIIE